MENMFFTYELLVATLLATFGSCNTDLFAGETGSCEEEIFHSGQTIYVNATFDSSGNISDYCLYGKQYNWQDEATLVILPWYDNFEVFEYDSSSNISLSLYDLTVTDDYENGNTYEWQLVDSSWNSNKSKLYLEGVTFYNINNCHNDTDYQSLFELYNGYFPSFRNIEFNFVRFINVTQCSIMETGNADASILRKVFIFDSKIKQFYENWYSKHVELFWITMRNVELYGGDKRLIYLWNIEDSISIERLVLSNVAVTNNEPITDESGLITIQESNNVTLHTIGLSSVELTFDGTSEIFGIFWSRHVAVSNFTFTFGTIYDGMVLYVWNSDGRIDNGTTVKRSFILSDVVIFWSNIISINNTATSEDTGLFAFGNSDACYLNEILVYLVHVEGYMFANWQCKDLFINNLGVIASEVSLEYPLLPLYYDWERMDNLELTMVIFSNLNPIIEEEGDATGDDNAEPPLRYVPSGSNDGSFTIGSVEDVLTEYDEFIYFGSDRRNVTVNTLVINSLNFTLNKYVLWIDCDDSIEQRFIFNTVGLADVSAQNSVVLIEDCNEEINETIVEIEYLVMVDRLGPNATEDLGLINWENSTVRGTSRYGLWLDDTVGVSIETLLCFTNNIKNTVLLLESTLNVLIADFAFDFAKEVFTYDYNRETRAVKQIVQILDYGYVGDDDNEYYVTFDSGYFFNYVIDTTNTTDLDSEAAILIDFPNAVGWDYSTSYEFSNVWFYNNIKNGSSIDPNSRGRYNHSAFFRVNDAWIYDGEAELEFTFSDCYFVNNNNFDSLIEIISGANIILVMERCHFENNIGSGNLLTNMTRSFTNIFHVSCSANVTIIIQDSTFIGTRNISDFVIVENDNADECWWHDSESISVECIDCVFYEDGRDFYGYTTTANPTTTDEKSTTLTASFTTTRSESVISTMATTEKESTNTDDGASSSTTVAFEESTTSSGITNSDHDTTAAVPIPTDEDAQDNEDPLVFGLKTEQIIQIGIFIILGVVVMGVCCVCIMKHRQHKKMKQNAVSYIGSQSDGQQSQHGSLHSDIDMAKGTGAVGSDSNYLTSGGAGGLALLNVASNSEMEQQGQLAYGGDNNNINNNNGNAHYRGDSSLNQQEGAGSVHQNVTGAAKYGNINNHDQNVNVHNNKNVINYGKKNQVQLMHGGGDEAIATASNEGVENLNAEVNELASIWNATNSPRAHQQGRQGQHGQGGGQQALPEQQGNTPGDANNGNMNMSMNMNSGRDDDHVNAQVKAENVTRGGPRLSDIMLAESPIVNPVNGVNVHENVDQVVSLDNSYFDELEQELHKKDDNGGTMVTPGGENENTNGNGNGNSNGDGYFVQDLHDALDAEDAVMDDIVQHMSTKK